MFTIFAEREAGSFGAWRWRQRLESHKSRSHYTGAPAHTHGRPHALHELTISKSAATDGVIALLQESVFANVRFGWKADVS